jgi:hypothetical protein
LTKPTLKKLKSHNSTFYVSQRLAGRIYTSFVSVNFYLFITYLYFSAAAATIPEEKEKSLNQNGKP